jgi:phosphoribosyl 1,2-cyclic phosphodiesterase
MEFRVRFWGVRGSIACPSPQHVLYGGNTSCIEVQVGDETIILDAGTGIRPLGRALMKRGVKKCRILLTHTHWDHINGFPFFGPGFVGGHQFEIRAGHLGRGRSIRDVLAGQMAQPTFPVPLEEMRATLSFVDFNAGDSFPIRGGVQVTTAPLNHPNGATGYRIEFGGKAFCYVTDTEHIPGKPDENILGLIEGADWVAYDSTYTDAEFPSHIGWGHSTWQEAIRLCKAANVKNLALFHHDPDHEDDMMAAIEAEAKATWDRTIAAREGLELQLIET